MLMTLPTITIHPSPTADSRTSDPSTVSIDQLRDSSMAHIADVQRGLALFQYMLADAATRHDTDKITDLAGFYANFQTGFAEQDWFDRHRKLNRHHLFQSDGVPKDVNLIDVLDLIADCVMAGLGRAGEVYPLNLDPDVLMTAFKNTVELLKAHVVVEPLPEGAPKATRPVVEVTDPLDGAFLTEARMAIYGEDGYGGVL